MKKVLVPKWKSKGDYNLKISINHAKTLPVETSLKKVNNAQDDQGVNGTNNISGLIPVMLFRALIFWTIIELMKGWVGHICGKITTQIQDLSAKLNNFLESLQLTLSLTLDY